MRADVVKRAETIATGANEKRSLDIDHHSTDAIQGIALIDQHDAEVRAPVVCDEFQREKANKFTAKEQTSTAQTYMRSIQEESLLFKAFVP